MMSCGAVLHCERGRRGRRPHHPQQRASEGCSVSSWSSTAGDTGGDGRQLCRDGARRSWAPMIATALAEHGSRAEQPDLDSDLVVVRCLDPNLALEDAERGAGKIALDEIHAAAPVLAAFSRANQRGPRIFGQRGPDHG